VHVLAVPEPLLDGVYTAGRAAAGEAAIALSASVAASADLMRRGWIMSGLSCQ
jgi:hypothetical protein